MNYLAPTERATRNIRAILGARRETIKELSVGSGIAHSTLNRRLLGASKFTIDELVAVSAHLGVSVSTLLEPAFEESTEA